MEWGTAGPRLGGAYGAPKVNRPNPAADSGLAVAHHVPGKTNPRLDEVVVVVAYGAVRCQPSASKAIRRTFTQTDLGQHHPIARRSARKNRVISNRIEIAVMIVPFVGIAQERPTQSVFQGYVPARPPP